MEKVIQVLTRVFTVLYFVYTIGMLLAFVAGSIVNMTKKKEEKKEEEESFEEQSAKLREELKETERELEKVKERRDEYLKNHAIRMEKLDNVLEKAGWGTINPQSEDFNEKSK